MQAPRFEPPLPMYRGVCFRIDEVGLQVTFFLPLCLLPPLSLSLSYLTKRNRQEGKKEKKKLLEVVGS